MYLPSGSTQKVVVPLGSGGTTAVVYTVTGHDGATIDSGSVAVQTTDTSADVVVDAEFNTLTNGPRWERRTVRWSYTTSGGFVVMGRFAYRVELGVEHDANPAMVRSLMGLNEDELADSDIDLTAAYFEFRSKVDAASMDERMLSTGSSALVVSRAIAAQCGLGLLAGLQLKLAIRESSGTNEYERQSIDWQALRDALSSVVQLGVAVIQPPATFLTEIFGVGARTDVITNQ